MRGDAIDQMIYDPKNEPAENVEYSDSVLWNIGIDSMDWQNVELLSPKQVQQIENQEENRLIYKHNYAQPITISHDEIRLFPDSAERLKWFIFESITSGLKDKHRNSFVALTETPKKNSLLACQFFASFIITV